MYIASFNSAKKVPDKEHLFRYRTFFQNYSSMPVFKYTASYYFEGEGEQPIWTNLWGIRYTSQSS